MYAFPARAPATLYVRNLRPAPSVNGRVTWEAEVILEDVEQEPWVALLDSRVWPNAVLFGATNEQIKQSAAQMLFVPVVVIMPPASEEIDLDLTTLHQTMPPIDG